MSLTRFDVRHLAVAVLLGVAPLTVAAADDSAPKAKPASATQPSPEVDDVPTYNLLDAMRDGLVNVEAQGRGDGRMTVSVTNTSKRKLRVVLPPGLVAQGATGQMGGMGGMGGGGMGGGGMGGGGRGGGGMGGMGGGRGGMGGGMGGGMMMGGVMPPTMGLMMLGRLIMSLAGDRDSWDQRSLMMGMMGGMGG
ncbi:MAG: hypothetical protein P4L85_11930, partial [Paludisphaera borealis]|nr:hypothetical protein [Paludisphaera borealis]